MTIFAAIYARLKMTQEEIRREFPQLEGKVYGKDLVWLDNAATSLRPRRVLAKWNVMSVEKNSNLHRAVHHTASEATLEYEMARDTVARAIGACCREEIVFTSGATASLNLLAFSLGELLFCQGDEVIVSEAEHHSNIVPWQMMCSRKGAVLKVLPVDDRGNLDIAKLPGLITPKTKVVSVAHVSNVLGIVNPIRRIADICHAAGVLLAVDGAQGIVHCSVDVAALGCDFYAFSGHKVYAAPGTGVLYGRKDLLEKMPPMFGGGEMIRTVKWEGTTYADTPQKFEAGTQNISGTPTLAEALEMARQMRQCEDYGVRDFVLDALLSDPSVHLFGVPDDPADKIPLFSFTVEGAHHEDLALILDKMGVAVRSGQMCAEPLMDRYGVTGMLRASFAPYNTMREAEYFIASLQKAAAMLR